MTLLTLDVSQWGGGGGGVLKDLYVGMCVPYFWI